MVIEEQFDADDILRDADDILRDADERYLDDDEEEALEDGEEEMRELNFGTLHDRNANFNDMASELDGVDDSWE